MTAVKAAWAEYLGCSGAVAMAWHLPDYKDRDEFLAKLDAAVRAYGEACQAEARHEIEALKAELAKQAVVR